MSAGRRSPGPAPQNAGSTPNSGISEHRLGGGILSCLASPSKISEQLAATGLTAVTADQLLLLSPVLAIEVHSGYLGHPTQTPAPRTL
jgi:hypothetical protein